MSRDNRYSFAFSPLFAGIYSAILLITAVIMALNSENNEQVIRGVPVLFSFLETDHLSVSTSILLSLLFLLLTSTSLYLHNVRIYSTGKSSLSLVFIYLILVFSSRDSIYFSGSTIASLLFVWSLYYSMLSAKGDSELFLSGFFISAASLFDFHIVAALPFIMYYSLVSTSFAIRGLVLYLVSVAIPLLFALSLRYLIFNDLDIFIDLFWRDIVSFASPFLKLESVADILLLVFAIFIIYRAVSKIFSRINRYKIVKSIGLTRSLSMLILLSALLVLYRDIQGNFMPLLAIPASMIVNEYLSIEDLSKNRKVEFFIFLILIAITRVSHFINW